MREKIFEYVKKKYGTEPDYPFRSGRTPITYPVLRHEDNRKIFALFMDAPMDKLGLEGTERVDIINVKMGDPLLADMLLNARSRKQIVLVVCEIHLHGTDGQAAFTGNEP